MEEDPAQARRTLIDNPTLGLALLKAQIRLNMVTAQSIATVLGEQQARKAAEEEARLQAERRAEEQRRLREEQHQQWRREQEQRQQQQALQPPPVPDAAQQALLQPLCRMLRSNGAIVQHDGPKIGVSA